MGPDDSHVETCLLPRRGSGIGFNRSTRTRGPVMWAVSELCDTMSGGVLGSEVKC